MNIDNMTAEELRTQRRSLMRGLVCLKKAHPAWDARTATRGEASMANLMQQVYEIDARLKALNGRAAA